MKKDSESRFTLKGVLKTLFFPLLIMVNPKIYYPSTEEDDGPPVGSRKGEGESRAEGSTRPPAAP